VQVTAAVVQVINLAAIWQSQRGQVAERVVLIAQRPVGRDVLRQPAQQVIGVLELFFRDTKLLACPSWLPLDAQQPVAIVISECLRCIAVDLGDQAANGITLEQRVPLWPFGMLAIANLIQSRQMATDVVAETPGQVIYPHLFNQPVRSVRRWR